ncbi:transmembrane protein 272-like isoform X2 [Ruditapes philippinarum]|uniref:transmembrane protein 272-like isoform X2 n=1 Tax=Ruditapes philippinarum TaxID=129788 RepID=UPI00295BA7F6|nr:transmembrane protein 272-like isoform X2 [Ruditapes philippinarum]
MDISHCRLKRSFKGPSYSESKEILYNFNDTGENANLSASNLFTGTSSCASPGTESEFGHQISLLQEYSTGLIDFVNKATDVIYRLVITKCLLVIVSVVPLSMLFVGSTYKNECPQKHMLTIYLSVGGGSGLLKLAFILLRHRKSPNYESLDDTDQDGDGSGDAVLSRSIKFTDCMLNIFIIVWFILGNEWYYAKPSPNFEQTLHEPNNWCDQFLYRYYFYMLIFSYISFSFIAFYILTLCYYYYRQNGMRLCKPILVI